MNLKSLLPQPVLLAHLMQWFQPGNSHSLNSGVTYDSANPAVIKRQIALAQSYGIDGFMVDWYGSQDTHGDVAFKNLLANCPPGFRAGVCIDKGAIKGAASATTAFQAELSYVESTYATQPAFFQDFVMEFGCGALGVNFSSVTTPLLHDSSTYGNFFTWVGLPSGASAVAASYSNPACKMGSVCWGFNDGGPANLNESVWNNLNPVRLLDRCHLENNWAQCWKNIPPGMKYVQLVTWNDYEEGTAIEGVLGMFQP